MTTRSVHATVTRLLGKVERLAHMASVLSPYSRIGAVNVSADRTTAFAVVTFDESATALPMSAINWVIQVAWSAGSATLQVELGGRAIEQANRASLGAATSGGLLAAVVVLLITFGSVLAAGLPVVTALLGLGVGLGLIDEPS